MKILNGIVILCLISATGWCAQRINTERKIVRQTRQLVVTDRENHEIVGTIDFRIMYENNARSPAHGFILNLFVKADCRGQGVGTLLLCRALQLMVAERCTYVQLIASPLEKAHLSDLQARTADLVRFYARLGGRLDDSILAAPGVGMRFNLLDEEVCALCSATAQPVTVWRVHELLAKRKTSYALHCFLVSKEGGELEGKGCLDEGAMSLRSICAFLVSCSDADALHSIENCTCFRDMNEITSVRIAEVVAHELRCLPEGVMEFLRLGQIKKLRPTGGVEHCRTVSPCGARSRGPLDRIRLRTGRMPGVE